MSLDSLSAALALVQAKVGTLVKKGSRKTFSETSQLLIQLVNDYGRDAEIHLVYCLLINLEIPSQSNNSSSANNNNNNNSNNSGYQQRGSSGRQSLSTEGPFRNASDCTNFLAQYFRTNSITKPKPGFLSNFCQAFEKASKASRIGQASVSEVGNCIRLNFVEQTVFGLCLSHSRIPHIVISCEQHLSEVYPKLLKEYTTPEGRHSPIIRPSVSDCEIETIHLILSSLTLHKTQYSVSDELITDFISRLRNDLAGGHPTILLPWLHSDRFSSNTSSPVELLDVDMSIPVKSITGSLALQIQELGPSLTSDVKNCEKQLRSLGITEAGNGGSGSGGSGGGGNGGVSSSSIAHVLAMMIRPNSRFGQGWSAPDSADVQWDVSVFVAAINGLIPDIKWEEVVGELDQPGFSVKDRNGLVLLMKGLEKGLQHNGVAFPVHHLYSKDWGNKEGQLSWIIQIIRNPDVFSFVDYPHQAAPMEILKSHHDESKKEIMAWKSLDLVNVLLHLSDGTGLYQEVQQILYVPMQQCPDILTLSLLQIPSPVNQLRKELLLNLIPQFFANHANSMPVLHHAWNTTILPQHNVRNLILNAMSAWYMQHQDDQGKLAKILEIAHELKALTGLFNSAHFMFALDLACLASKRDFLKLDKWLTDKIHEHKEHFVKTCIQFIRRRSTPPAMGQMVGDRTPASPLPPEVITAILSALHGVINNLNAQLQHDVRTLLTQFAGKANIGGGGVGGGGGGVGGHSAGSERVMGILGVGGTGGSGAGGGGSGFGELMPIQPPTRNPFSAPTPTYLNMGASATLSPNRLTGTLSPNRLTAAAGAGAAGGRWGATGPAPFRPPQNQVVPGSQPSLAPTPAFPPPHNLIHAGGSMEAGSAQVGGADTGQSALNPSVGGANQASTTIPDIAQSFSDDVQEEANSYFQQIYSQPPQPCMSIGDFIAILKQFKDSDNPKHAQVFGCMLKNLFEEYRFFPVYPDRELYTTALVYGSIIRENIINGMYMAYAMRGVMEALKREYQTKMFYFGLGALDQFKTRLKDYPRYSQCIMALPHFEKFPPNVIEYVKAGANSVDPLSSVLGPEQAVVPQSLLNQINLKQTGVTSQMMGTGGEGKGMVGGSQCATPIPSLVNAPSAAPRAPSSLTQATNINTLVNATEKAENQVTVPPDTIQEKVAFLFNNLSQANLTKKVEELWEAVMNEKEDNLPWLAQYLVMKRVSIEPNFHNLYANFVNEFKNNKFHDQALQETFRNVRILLRSDKRQAASNFADRQLLKNLGHWLGMITLAKNKAIFFQDLDIKSLLLEGYYKGQQELLFVVPFVAKILESCQKSIVFRAPNAWTMAILNLLAELHAEPDLKLNLKFEIEVLCKALNVDLHSLKPGTLLKNTDRLEALMSSGVQQLDDVKMLTKQTDAMAITASPVPHGHGGVGGGDSSGGMVGGGRRVDEPHPGSPPPAKFSYHDIVVTSFSGLAPHLNINPNLDLFQMNPPLKNLVRPAIEHAVRELMTPVAERAIKVALTTTEHVVKKDFALEADEGRMRAAAHHMVRSLTAGMAMITCREPLLVTIQGYLKQAFYSSFRGASSEQQKIIEEAATTIADDHVELAQCFIVKTACEKAIPEVDKRLEHEFSIRRTAKMENRRYCDPSALTYQAERMPEPIRLKVGSVTGSQQEIYKQFSHNISGFKPTTADDLIVGFPVEQVNKGRGAGPSDEECEAYYLRLIRDVDTVLASNGQNPLSGGMLAMRAMKDALAMAAQQPKDPTSATNLVQKLVDMLLNGYKMQSGDPEGMVRLREGCLLSIRAVVNIFSPSWVKDVVTKSVIDCRQDYKFNLDAIDILIRAPLINLPEYDKALAETISEGMNFSANLFAQHLIKLYFKDERVDSMHNIRQADFQHTIEALAKVSGAYGTGSTGSRDTLAITMFKAERNRLQTMLDEMIRNDGSEGNKGSVQAAQQQAAAQQAHQQILMPPPSNQPPPSLSFNAMPPVGGDDSSNTELQQKAEAILRDWLPIAYTATYLKEPEKAFSLIVQTMHSHGILRTDDMITRFFRLCTEMCVDLTYRLLNDPQTSHLTQVVRGRCFYTLDAYVRLISVLVKHSGDGHFQFSTKINLLNKVLGVIASVLIQDHEVRGTEFHQLPYHRLLIMLFWELTTPDPLLDAINFQILTSFCNTLHVLQPRKVAGFSYAWLDMVGHRAFLGRMLFITPQNKAWAMYAQLIIDHLKFLSPFLRNIDLPKPIALMYKGTLRVLLVLLHDFPELLCEYHYLLCDVIPPNCVQLRNLVLSAYPRNMRLPDPFLPNLKVDQLSEMSASPSIPPNLAQVIQTHELLEDLDSYLQNRTPVSFLSQLTGKLKVSEESGWKYNVSVMNAIVVHVGMKAIEAIQEKGQRPSPVTIAHSSYMDIFQSLAVNLDTEGRYLFFNAIANQLRYPNSHTHYFSCTLLYLFSESNQEVIQEQITRILFERLVALRPHPWGLLITFIELIKNQHYNFWNHVFVRCAPEIERLFESVAASCFKQQYDQQQQQAQQAQQQVPQHAQVVPQQPGQSH